MKLRESTQTGLLFGLLLVSCGAGSGPGVSRATVPAPAVAASSAVMTSPAAAADLRADDQQYTLTVPITAAETEAQVAARFGGRVKVWQPAHHFAVLTLNGNGSGGALTASRAAASGTLELNRGVFAGSGQLAWMNGMVSAWAGGSVSAWAGGMVSAWAGGMVSAWAGGAYVPVPQNTAKWKRLGLDSAQALASRLGEGVTVAIIDSGIDLNHPALEGGLVPAAQMWDYVGHDARPQEEGTLGQGSYGHGTSVAGIVLQIAPRARLLPLRVLGPAGSGDVADVAAAISRAVAQGADIINLSLGSDVRSEAVASAIDAATAEGVFVISSSGNTSDEHITFPASQANLDGTTAGLYSVSVGSVDDLDHKSAFSTYGAALELVAPGEVVYGPVPGKRLGAWSGTSMAAPMVSGALALALGQSLTTSPQLLTDRLKNRAVNVTRHELNPAYDDLLGKGRLSIADFLRSVMF